MDPHCIEALPVCYHFPLDERMARVLPGRHLYVSAVHAPYISPWLLRGSMWCDYNPLRASDLRQRYSGKMSATSAPDPGDAGSTRRDSGDGGRTMYDVERALTPTSAAAGSGGGSDKDRAMYCDRKDSSHLGVRTMMNSQVDALVSAAHRLREAGGGCLVSEVDMHNAVKHIKVEEGAPPKTRSSLGPCKVCGDEATGMYFGALVCVPCKTFFLRYAGDNFAFVCKHEKNCEISISTRTQCKYCRYQKCLKAGMCRRERPAQVQLSEGQQLCVVCQDIANGVHFGAITCEGCKKFFRRGLTEHSTYSCKNEEKCLINPRTRNSCRFCRYKKCIEAGMSREAIQMGRPSKIKHSGSELEAPPEPKMPRLHIENISASLARDIVGTLPSNGEGGHGQEARYAPAPAAITNAGMKQFGQPSCMSPPIRMQSYPPTSSPNFHKPHASAAEGQHALGGMPVLRPQRAMPESPSPDYSLGAAPGKSYNDPRQSDHSPQSEELSRGSPFSEGPMSPSVQQPRANPIPFNLFPTPSPSSDVRFHGPAGPQKVDPHSVNAAHLIQQIISQNTAENGGGGGDVLHQPPPRDGGEPNAQAHSTLESVAPALPMQLAFQNIKQEFARAALSMYPPVNPRAAPLQSVNSPASDCMPSPDTTSAASPLCAMSPLLPATATSPPHQPETATAWRAADAGASQPQSVSTTVLSSLVELSENLQRLSQGQSLTGTNSEGSQEGDSNSNRSLIAKDTDTGFQELDFRLSVNYWLRPDLPDENLLFSEDHWRIIDQIMPAYNRFVETGSSINRKLSNEVENWDKINKDQKIPQEWINAKVVPVYTLSSVTFSRDLPDFTKFDIADQCTLVRLGQSQSRILVAAIHWYDPQLRDFRDFLSWRKMEPGREDFFKKQLVEYSRVVHSLELDNIEAGLVNVLVIIAKDYPGLKKPDLIEQSRARILQTFRAYTTAKYGTPNRRIETLFSHIPELRQLGFMHHRMTLDLQLKAEECITGTD